MIYAAIYVYEAPSYSDALAKAVAMEQELVRYGAHLDGPPAERAPLVQFPDNEQEDE